MGLQVELVSFCEDREVSKGSELTLHLAAFARHYASSDLERQPRHIKVLCVDPLELSERHLPTRGLE